MLVSDVVVSIYTGNAERQADRLIAEFGGTNLGNDTFGNLDPGGIALPFVFRLLPDLDAVVMVVQEPGSQVDLACVQDAVADLEVTTSTS